VIDEVITMNPLSKDKLMKIPEIDLGDIYLRAIKLSDAPDMYEYGGDPEVTKWLTWPTHKTVEDSIHSINNYFLKRHENNVPSAHAIIHKETKKMIGTCDFCNMDWEQNSGEIGYCINRNYWGKGYVTKACKAVIAFGFNYLKLDKVTIRHASENIRSKRVVEKCGFRYVKDVYYKPYDKKIPSYEITRGEYEVLSNDTV